MEWNPFVQSRNYVFSALSQYKFVCGERFFKCGGTNGDVWRGNSSFKGERATQTLCIRSICEVTRMNRIRNKAVRQMTRVEKGWEIAWIVRFWNVLYLWSICVRSGLLKQSSTKLWWVRVLKVGLAWVCCLELKRPTMCEVTGLEECKCEL